MEKDTMDATSLHVRTCQLILQAKAEDPSIWSELHNILPSLRQSLSCIVCGRLLSLPYSPTDSNCQHNVCKSCKGGRKKLRSTCSWCKDYNKYVENVELRTLLQCYKKLCQYITTTNIFQSLNPPSCSSANTVTLDANKALLDIINEGAGIKDNFRFEPKSRNSAAHTKGSPSTALTSGKNGAHRNSTKNATVNGESTYSVISTNNGNRLTFKRTAKDINDDGQRNGEAEKTDVKVNKVRKRSVFLKLPTCKCGQNAPAKGTCRGYRCPCYTADKPCSPECNCVACKNPRGTPPPKEEGSAETATQSTAEPLAVTTT